MFQHFVKCHIMPFSLHGKEGATGTHDRGTAGQGDDQAADPGDPSLDWPRSSLLPFGSAVRFLMLLGARCRLGLHLPDRFRRGGQGGLAGPSALPPPLTGRLGLPGQLPQLEVLPRRPGTNGPAPGLGIDGAFL